MCCICTVSLGRYRVLVCTRIAKTRWLLQSLPADSFESPEGPSSPLPHVGRALELERPILTTTVNPMALHNRLRRGKEALASQRPSKRKPVSRNLRADLGNDYSVYSKFSNRHSQNWWA